MRLAICVLVGLLVITPAFTETEAQEKIWRGKRIQVFDYMPASWDGVVAAVVDDANAIMPRRGPRVIYNRMGSRLCKDIPRMYGIVVCIDDEPWPAELNANAGFMKRREPDKKISVVAFREGAWSRSTMQSMACHEVIGHAILGIPDNHFSKQSEESCVHAWAESPGIWDEERAKDLYGRH